MNKLMFTLGLMLMSINLIAMISWIGLEVIDFAKINPGDFMLPVFVISCIASLFMVIFGAFQK